MKQCVSNNSLSQQLNSHTGNVALLSVTNSDEQYLLNKLPRQLATQHKDAEKLSEKKTKTSKLHCSSNHVTVGKTSIRHQL